MPPLGTCASNHRTRDSPEVTKDSVDGVAGHFQPPFCVSLPTSPPKPPASAKNRKYQILFSRCLTGGFSCPTSYHTHSKSVWISCSDFSAVNKSRCFSLYITRTFRIYSLLFSASYANSLVFVVLQAKMTVMKEHDVGGAGVHLCVAA